MRVHEPKTREAGSDEFTIKTGNGGADSEVTDKVRRSCQTETRMNHKYGEPGCTSLVQTKNNKSHPLLKTSALLIIAALRTPRVYRLPGRFKWDGAETRSTGKGKKQRNGSAALFGPVYLLIFNGSHSIMSPLVGTCGVNPG